MKNQNNKVFTASQKQQEFDANFQEDVKVYEQSQKQQEFDANFVEEEKDERK